MEDLTELIEIYKNRADELRLEAELSHYLASKETDEIEFSANENELIASLLNDFNKVLGYDEVAMYYKINYIGIKQSTTLKLPLSESTSIITVMDLNSEEEIDMIKLKQPLNRKEFISFAQQYYKHL